MANFQKILNDKTTRFDTDMGLVLMLEETVSIDLWGGGPNGEELVVDVDDPVIASVSEKSLRRSGWLSTYAVTGLKSGTSTLTARLFNQTPANYVGRRQVWFSMPVWASIPVSVMGVEFRQADGVWGQTKYGSTNPAWKNVKWTTMALAGCGPTSLAIIMDYLIRLDSPDRNVPASLPGTDPSETMDYTSRYGRAADDKGQPSGTSGPVMINNISKYWPDYEGRQVASVDEAVMLLKQLKPLVFLCRACTTWRYGKAGKKDTHTWGGHFMVLVGVEHDGQTFWISDPSRAHHKFISRKELQKCSIWYVHKRGD